LERADRDGIPKVAQDLGVAESGGAGKYLYAQAAADGCLRVKCVCRFPKTADEEEKSGKTVRNAIYWALPSGDF
jgi:hypothetical protein